MKANELNVEESGFLLYIKKLEKESENKKEIS
jgi:hypothetical protein